MNPALESLSCFDDRFHRADAFTDWAQTRWVQYQADGPLAHVPVRKAYTVADWRGAELDHYGALYAPEVASDLVDFSILERYTSSLQQTLIRDPKPELDWFFPEKETEGVLGLLRYWQGIKKIWTGDELTKIVAAWKLPPAFDWLGGLNFKEGVVHEHDDEASLTGATDQGYVTFFVLNG